MVVGTEEKAGEKMSRWCLVGCLVLAMAGSLARAADSMPLWPDGHAALEGVDKKNFPALFVHKPSPGIKTANVIVLVCPGGGYRGQTMGDEGHSVAAWYAKQGITGVVLKYRLPKQGKWSPEKEFSTLRDAQRAVQLMRYKSKELGMPDAKIGILGFSAGGHLSCMTATRWREADASAKDPIEKLSSRPDFACLIYPVISMMDHGHGGSRGNLLGKSPSEETRKKYSGEFNVTKDTPPIFMVHANNDGVKPENSFVFYQALRKQGKSVEMHIVSKGNHGFFDGKGWGIPGKAAIRFSRAGGMWPIWTLDWMLEEKLVDKPEQWQWTQRRQKLKAVVDPPAQANPAATK
jgi:acetyl esterase/lipase